MNKISDLHIDLDRDVWVALDGGKYNVPDKTQLHKCRKGDYVYETRDIAFAAMVEDLEDSIAMLERQLAKLRRRRDVVAERRASEGLGIVGPDDAPLLDEGVLADPHTLRHNSENDIPF